MQPPKWYTFQLLSGILFNYYLQRLEKRLWHQVAVREAVINAFVHNDYSREIAPTFEIFDDRMEITSYGGLPDGLKKEEFFEGFSVPRNKELMRIYKDLDFVEQLGSGIPRILEFYNKDDFRFSESFLRIILPASQATQQVPSKYRTSTEQVPNKSKNYYKYLQANTAGRNYKII